MKNFPIGIFDSGVGGLSVFKELYNLLPQENYIYFGDTKNLPYGSKTKEELILISRNIFDYFRSQKVKAVVMACNTTSAVTYDVLKNDYDFKIYPLVQTVAKTIADTNVKKIGVFATAATINSHAYRENINKINKNIEVVEIACPKWVNIVENQLQSTPESIMDIKMHLEEMLAKNVDKIILGCTHYPYLIEELSKFAPKDMFINPAQAFAKCIIEDLTKSDLLNNGEVNAPQFYVSGSAAQFKSASKLFFDVKEAKEILLV